MSNRTSLLVFLAAAASTVALLGCQQLQCAEGTHEANGECRPDDETVNPAICGPGTILGSNGMCKPELPVTECGDQTTGVPCPDDPSITCCIGTGGGDCESDITCPAAVNAKVNLCGRLYDLETDQQIRAGTPAIADCEDPNSNAAPDGPCQLNIEVYDAINFAMNPGGATPLPHDDLYLDDCGRYKITGITAPNSGYLGIGAEDAIGQPATHRLTGVAVASAPNLTFNKQVTYSATTATDTKWSTAANLSGGTFADRGAYVGIFLHHGDPVEGVTITSNNTEFPNNDFYFSDTDPSTRSTLDPSLTATGLDGTGVMINIVSLPDMSGNGGEDTGCMWPADKGGSIPSVLFVQQRIEKMGTVDCP
jgi:hypothetical protein